MLPTFHVSPSAGHRKWVFHGCEWAGVRGVQSVGQGPEVEGRIQRYGLLPGRSVSVCNSCSGHSVVLSGACERNCVCVDSLLAFFFCSLLEKKLNFNFVSESQDSKVQVLSLFLRLHSQFWWEWGSSLWLLLVPLFTGGLWLSAVPPHQWKTWSLLEASTKVLYHQISYHQYEEPTQNTQHQFISLPWVKLTVKSKVTVLSNSKWLCSDTVFFLLIAKLMEKTKPTMSCSIIKYIPLWHGAVASYTLLLL